jgi:putative transcriptional regulator
MKMRLLKVDPAHPPAGRGDEARLAATTEEDIARQQQADDDEATQEAARYTRRIRKRLGLTQVEFARRIDVSLITVQQWEQGKQRPTGAAKTLLKVLDKAPEPALSALG